MCLSVRTENISRWKDGALGNFLVGLNCDTNWLVLSSVDWSANSRSLCVLHLPTVHLSSPVFVYMLDSGFCVLAVCGEPWRQALCTIHVTGGDFLDTVRLQP